MLIGKVLKIGSISREKVPATNTPKPENVSTTDAAQTVPVTTVESLLELNGQADETANLDTERDLSAISI